MVHSHENIKYLHAVHTLCTPYILQCSYVYYIYYGAYVRKGKSVLLHAWSGPECSRKLRFPDYMTTAQDGGKVVSLMLRPPLPPGNAPGTHFC